MTLPIDLVLVRHGQSEGNIAHHRSEKGDDSLFTDEFRDRHTSSFRLSTRGRRQAERAGFYLRQAWPDGFDRHITSEYIRAMETAALLQLPGALWYGDFYLTERDWGEIDHLTAEEKEERFSRVMRQKETEPFFWKPPNGESFADLCLRVDRVLHTLHRECSDKRVLIVCHGEVMLAFRIRIERLSQLRFKEITLSQEPADHILNCQIVQYTRRDPHQGKLTPYVGWARDIRPTEDPCFVSEWRNIKRPRYSNKDLEEVVSRVPAMITE